MKIPAFILTLLLSAASHAGPECTKEPKSKWQDQAKFKQSLQEKYKIKVFKVTKGNCYEIYGWNKEGKKIEIYFNPITGDIVKEEIN